MNPPQDPPPTPELLPAETFSVDPEPLPSLPSKDQVQALLLALEKHNAKPEALELSDLDKAVLALARSVVPEDNPPSVVGLQALLRYVESYIRRLPDPAPPAGGGRDVVVEFSHRMSVAGKVVHEAVGSVPLYGVLSRDTQAEAIAMFETLLLHLVHPLKTTFLEVCNQLVGGQWPPTLELD